LKIGPQVSTLEGDIAIADLIHKCKILPTTC